MAGWKVAERTQVHREGVTYGGGETFQADEDDEIELWLKAGWISPTKAPARPAARKG